MLKIITSFRDHPESITVHLYGQFTGEYVAEVERALSVRSANKDRVTLNLANVTFVDRAGMMFLLGVKPENVAVEHTPSYVTRWIEQEGRRGPAPSEPY